MIAQGQDPLIDDGPMLVQGLHELQLIRPCLTFLVLAGGGLIFILNVSILAGGLRGHVPAGHHPQEDLDLLGFEQVA